MEHRSRIQRRKMEEAMKDKERKLRINDLDYDKKKEDLIVMVSVSLIILFIVFGSGYFIWSKLPF